MQRQLPLLQLTVAVQAGMQAGITQALTAREKLKLLVIKTKLSKQNVCWMDGLPLGNPDTGDCVEFIHSLIPFSK